MTCDSSHISHSSQTLNIFREVVSIIVMGALWGLLFGSAIIGMSGHFGPDDAPVVACAEVDHGR